MNLPDDWKILVGSIEKLPLKFHKLYPDGTDVIIEIRLVEKVYEIWSSAEHRSSGPNENLESKSEDLADAIDLAIVEMKGWDEYL